MNRICAPRATTRRPVFRARCSSASWTRGASLRESAGMAPGTFEERILTEEGALSLFIDPPPHPPPRRGRRPRSQGSLRSLLLAALALPGVAARAHDLSFTDTRLALRGDGTFRADLRCDLDALALGTDPKADAREVVAAIRSRSPAERDILLDRLRELLSRRVRVRFDGTPAPFEVGFPERVSDPAAVADVPGATVFGLTAELTGRVPPGALEVTFWASRGFPPVNLTVAQEGLAEPARFVLQSGEESPPIRLGRAARGPGRGETALRYLRLGFRHIVPEGTDHMLFVLGLHLRPHRDPRPLDPGGGPPVPGGGRAADRALHRLRGGGEHAAAGAAALAGRARVRRRAAPRPRLRGGARGAGPPQR